MVGINGNFRNQQLYLGANRNLSTAKATLQANTGAATFRPSGKTATFELTELNNKPEQYKTDYKPDWDGKSLRDLGSEFVDNLKDGDTVTTNDGKTYKITVITKETAQSSTRETHFDRVK